MVYGPPLVSFSLNFIQITYVGHITKDFILYEEQKNRAMLETIVHIGTNQLTSLNVSSDFESYIHAFRLFSTMITSNWFPPLKYPFYALLIVILKKVHRHQI